jgi:RNA-directed DNA polymerase
MNTVDPQPLYGWSTLCWKKIERVVFKLQTRIYRAQRRGDGAHDWGATRESQPE